MKGITALPHQLVHRCILVQMVIIQLLEANHVRSVPRDTIVWESQTRPLKTLALQENGAFQEAKPALSALQATFVKLQVLHPLLKSVQQGPTLNRDLSTVRRALQGIIVLKDHRRQLQSLVLQEHFPQTVHPAVHLALLDTIVSHQRAHLPMTHSAFQGRFLKKVHPFAKCAHLDICAQTRVQQIKKSTIIHVKMVSIPQEVRVTVLIVQQGSSA